MIVFPVSTDWWFLSAPLQFNGISYMQSSKACVNCYIASSYYYVCYISGLSRLTSDPRSAIRKSALEVLFNILKDHGHLFSRQFWINVFSSIIFPIFESVTDKKETKFQEDQSSTYSSAPHRGRNNWDAETSAVAAQNLVNIFVTFFNVVRSQLHGLVSILADLIRSGGKGYASTGVTALMQLVKDLGGRLSEDEWTDLFLALNDSAASTLPGILRLVRTMDSSEMPDHAQAEASDSPSFSGNGFTADESEDDNLQTAAYVVSRMKSHIAALLLILQVLFVSLAIPALNYC